MPRPLPSIQLATGNDPIDTAFQHASLNTDLSADEEISSLLLAETMTEVTGPRGIHQTRTKKSNSPTFVYVLEVVQLLF